MLDESKSVVMETEKFIAIMDGSGAEQVLEQIIEDLGDPGYLQVVLTIDHPEIPKELDAIGICAHVEGATESEMAVLPNVREGLVYVLTQMLLDNDAKEFNSFSELIGRPKYLN